MKEKWKPITDCEGYEVSSCGQVRSYRYDRGVHVVPKILTPTYTHNGYIFYRIRKNIGKFKNFRVARLVAKEFIGEPKDPKMVVDHIDNNKTNNHFSNLQYLTPGQNTMKPGSGTFSEVNSRKTHCPRGHSYSPENTYMNNGSRICRACKVVRRREAKGEKE